MDKPKIFTRNRYGISIVKCCASCKFKRCDNRVRLCINGEGAVPPDYLCGDWRLAEGLDNAGKGGGKVKKQTYLRYSIDSLMEENKRLIDAANRKMRYMCKTITEIRKEYSDCYGNIYEDI